MNRRFEWLLLALLAVLVVGGAVIWSQQPDVVVLNGTAKGWGGDVTVTVTMQGDNIVGVEAVGENETPGIGTKALEEIPVAIVAANATDVDAVSSATVTSKAIIDAVNNALDPEKYPAPAEPAQSKADPVAVTAAKVTQGFGLANLHRVGPGKDDTGTPVYSVNQVFAHALFDEDDRILALHVDQLEVATPNYDGAGMPHFSGFPGQGGYNYDEDHDGKVNGKTPDTEENFVAEIEGWMTKRDRGDTYRMGTGTWSEQMDAFEDIFIGMTVDEVEDWFAKYTSDVNGRPLQANASRDQDKAKYAALTNDEKVMLTDATTRATMSLNDGHGDIIAAIRAAYENRVGIDIDAAAASGFGLMNMARIGPGADNTGTPVYSVNQVFANTLFDEDGRILALYVDQLEVATPNYDGAGMPHFSGFPGQGGYNNDENHDGKIDGKTPDTEEQYAAEIAGWMTKRDRGESYRMGAGTWSEQMDAFQDIFIGMTVDEVEDWFAKYTSDVNGRPLKPNASRDADKAKYDALSADEQAMLVDATTRATMSLNDSHGDIIGAIRQSYANRVNIDLKVK